MGLYALVPCPHLQLLAFLPGSFWSTIPSPPQMELPLPNSLLQLWVLLRYFSRAGTSTSSNPLRTFYLINIQ